MVFLEVKLVMFERGWGKEKYDQKLYMSRCVDFLRCRIKIHVTILRFCIT